MIKINPNEKEIAQFTIIKIVSDKKKFSFINGKIGYVMWTSYDPYYDLYEEYHPYFEYKIAIHLDKSFTDTTVYIDEYSTDSCVGDSSFMIKDERYIYYDSVPSIDLISMNKKMDFPKPKFSPLEIVKIKKVDEDEFPIEYVKKYPPRYINGVIEKSNLGSEKNEDIIERNYLDLSRKYYIAELGVDINAYGGKATYGVEIGAWAPLDCKEEDLISVGKFKNIKSKYDQK